MADISTILSYQASNGEAARALYAPSRRRSTLRYQFILPTSFVTGGMLLFDRVEHWRRWNKRVFADCACGPSNLSAKPLLNSTAQVGLSQ